MDKQAAKFAQGVLEAAVKAHIMHWMTKSYAQHMALGDLYDGLPDLIDSVVEQYIGKYGVPPFKDEDPVAFAQELSSFIATYRDFCEDSEIQNDIDAIASLVDSTMYKLKRFK
jgi:hypothetical protein